MFRKTTYLAAGLVLALAAPAARADDDWDDYRERLEELRERQRERYEDLRERERERYEDWREDQREAREDYREWMEDQRDRRRGWSGPGFPATPGYYRGPTYGVPAFYPRVPAWRPRYDEGRPGGFFFRGPRGRGVSIRW